MLRLLAEELADEEFEPIEFSWEDEKASPTFLPDLARSLLEGVTSLGSGLSVGDGIRVIEGALANCRYRLTPSEIDRFRQLGSDAGRVLGRLVSELKPAETEQEVARRVAEVLAAGGMHAIVSLVAADERIQQFRHPIPTGRRWEKILMVVVCARRRGLVVSLTRIVCAGEVPTELRRRTDAVAHVNANLLGATRPGVTGAELYRTAARTYAGQGFAGEERLHHQGGATGYRTRDWVAHPASAEVVYAGQAFAWNPSITGTKVEETCVAFDEEIEPITSTSDWPRITVEVNEREYHSPDVLSL